MNRALVSLTALFSIIAIIAMLQIVIAQGWDFHVWGNQPDLVTFIKCHYEKKKKKKKHWRK